jgi:hypothetical protein
MFELEDACWVERKQEEARCGAGGEHDLLVLWFILFLNFLPSTNLNSQQCNAFTFVMAAMYSRIISRTTPLVSQFLRQAPRPQPHLSKLSPTLQPCRYRYTITIGQSAGGMTRMQKLRQTARENPFSFTLASIR